MTSKADAGGPILVPGLLFVAAGVFWVAIVALGGGPFLVWAALTSILSGLLLLLWPTNRLVNPLVVASALFGIVLTLYQLYVGLTLIGSIFTTVAIYNTVPFALFAVLYGYLLFFTRPVQVKA